MTTIDAPEEQPRVRAVATSRPARFGPWRREVRAFLELLALAGVAVAQPTFDILSKDANTFITRRTTPFQAVLFAALVVLVPPLAAWTFEVLVGVALPRARRYVHALLCGFAVGVIAVEVLKKQTPLTSSRLVAGGVLAGLAGAALVWRFDIVRMWLRYLAFASVVFAVMFLFFSPVTSVVFRSDPASASGVEVRDPARVVEVVLDEFPLMSILDGNGRVDAALFPNFARLAATSTWYRNTTTVAPNTSSAVPAILTGDMPEERTPPVATEYPDNLFTLLGSEYEMNVHESISQLCPVDVCGDPKHAPAQSSFGGLVDDAWLVWRQFASPTDEDATIDLALRNSPTADEALQTGANFVDSLEPSSRPRVDFLHVLLPHQPWHYLPTGQDNTELKGSARGTAFYHWGAEEAVLQGRQRHLFNVQAADRMIGDVIDKLERIGAWEDTLFVVTADHGFSFVPKQPIRGVSADNYHEVIWIPLFVKLPGQTSPEVDDRPVLSIDVLPTIADVLGADAPFDVEGRSTLGEARNDGARPVIDWKLNLAEPTTEDELLELDGPSGFEKVLEGRASAARGDPALRLYKIGPYADLLGQPVEPLVDDSNGSPRGVIDAEDSFDRVDPDARKIPWQYIEGTIEGQPTGQPIAVAVNGRVASFAWASAPFLAPRADFWASLPPQMMARGRNDVGVYLIEGPPSSPRLVPVDLGE
jgi:hypothetical protein